MRSAEREQRALVLEQETLEVQPAAEAGKRSVGADHTMARQDERQRVLAVRSADRARRIRAEAESARLLSVTHGLAVRDRCKREPALPLEVGAVQVERQVELDQVAGEVGVELGGGGLEHRAALVRKALCRPEHAAEPGVRADEAERPDGCFDCAAWHGPP